MQLSHQHILTILATLGLTACSLMTNNNEVRGPVIVETAQPASAYPQQPIAQPAGATRTSATVADHVEPNDEKTLQKVSVDTTPVSKELIGGSIEKSMDESDKSKMSRALDKSPGKMSAWTNTRTGIHYEVTPIKKIVINDNPFCREYQATTRSTTHSQQVTGVACIAADGNWHTVSN